MKSPAKDRKLMDTLLVDSASQRKQRYAVPLGIGLFAFIIYMGFFRNYNNTDKSTFQNITRDIRDRYPGAQEKLGHIETAPNKK